MFQSVVCILYCVSLETQQEGGPSAFALTRRLTFSRYPGRIAFFPERRPVPRYVEVVLARVPCSPLSPLSVSGTRGYHHCPAS